MLAFSTATINDANAAAVGLAMANRFRDDIVAHAAWDLVEEYTPGGGAVAWTVFKCLASASGLSADYYVVMGRTIATGELRFAIAEGYSSSTHTMSRFAPVVANTVAFDAVGAYPDTYVLGTAAFSNGQKTPSYQSWTPGGASAKFWLIVDDDGLTAAWNGLAEGFIHLGAYIPFTDQANTMPLMITGMSVSGAITRNPALAGASAANLGIGLYIQGGGTANEVDGGTQVLGFRGDMRYNDAFHSGKRLLAEIGIVMYQNTPASQESYGWALGKQKRMRLGGGSPPAGFAWGDSYILDGQLWVPWKPTDKRIWNTGVAA
jgi:hypothetical protein